jgi:hypothetical protein
VPILRANLAPAGVFFFPVRFPLNFLRGVVTYILLLLWKGLNPQAATEAIIKLNADFPNIVSLYEVRVVEQQLYFSFPREKCQLSF